MPGQSGDRTPTGGVPSGRANTYCPSLWSFNNLFVAVLLIANKMQFVIVRSRVLCVYASYSILVANIVVYRYNC